MVFGYTIIREKDLKALRSEFQKISSIADMNLERRQELVKEVSSLKSKLDTQFKRANKFYSRIYKVCKLIDEGSRKTSKFYDILKGEGKDKLPVSGTVRVDAESFTNPEIEIEMFSEETHRIMHTKIKEGDLVRIDTGYIEFKKGMIGKVVEVQYDGNVIHVDGINKTSSAYSPNIFLTNDSVTKVARKAKGIKK